MNECFQVRAGCSPRAGQSFCEGFDFGMGWEGGRSGDDKKGGLCSLGLQGSWLAFAHRLRRSFVSRCIWSERWSLWLLVVGGRCVPW